MKVKILNSEKLSTHTFPPPFPKPPQYILTWIYQNTTKVTISTTIKSVTMVTCNSLAPNGIRLSKIISVYSKILARYCFYLSKNTNAFMTHSNERIKLFLRPLFIFHLGLMNQCSIQGEKNWNSAVFDIVKVDKTNDQIASMRHFFCNNSKNVKSVKLL